MNCHNFLEAGSFDLPVTVPRENKVNEAGESNEQRLSMLKDLNSILLRRLSTDHKYVGQEM
jgi:hypothetical protein